MAYRTRAAAHRVGIVLALGLLGCEARSEPPVTEEASATPSAVPSSAAAPPPSVAPSAEVVEAPADRLVIVAGGDVNLGRGLGQQILRGEAIDPLRELRTVLASADLRFVNLESQLSDQDGETQSGKNPLIFTGPPGGAALLSRMGIDVVSVANNHMWDYGGKAFLETLAHLGRAGVAYAGASQKPGKMYEPTVIRVRGWSVAFFAVTHIWNQGPFQEHRGKHYVAWADFERMRVAVKRARREHDLVIVSYHGGSEYVDTPMTWTRVFVKVMMKAGADALIGHHPHVPHGVGWHEGRPAFYSLGNLVFHMHRDYPWTGIGYLARLTFRRAKLRPELEVEACPYHILGVTPHPFSGAGQAAQEQMFRRRLELGSKGLGGTQVGSVGEQGCVPLSPPA